MSDKPSFSDPFQQRMKAALKLRGWTQQELASQMGVAQGAIDHFEAGSRWPIQILQ